MAHSSDHEEPARRLARKLGAVRRRGDTLTEASWADAALVDALQDVTTKRDADLQVSPTASQSARMWRAIEAEMEPAPSLADRLQERLNEVWRGLASPPVRRWAVATALFLGIIVAWVVLRPAGPERVAAAEGRLQTYTTPDGATVTLRPHSSLYRVPADTVSRYRLRGEAHFEVPSMKSASAFEVQTDEAQVRVRGTRFVVRTWKEGTEVYLAEGTVQLRARASAPAPVLLKTGQRASVFPDGTVTPPSSASRPAYVGWIDRTLSFERRPLRDIIEELEYHYDIALRVPDTLRSQTLSGQISLADRSQSLHDLAVVLGGRFERTDDETYRFVAQ